MALENVSELSRVLGQRQRLGLVFARHAYGMRAWVDLFSARVPAVADPEAKALLAQLVADNARHMMLFRERASPTASTPTPTTPRARARSSTSGSTTSPGSASWPATRSGRWTTSASSWRCTGTPPRARTARRSTTSRPTCSGMLVALRPLAGADGARRAAEAHELYRVRELVETPRYAHAG